MKHDTTLCIFNIKGGEGKTTTVINLASALAEEDQKVLMVDIDSQGSLTIKSGYDLFTLEATLYHVLLNEQELHEVIQPTPLHPKVFLAPADLGLVIAERKLFAGNPVWGLRLQEVLQPVRQEYDYILIDCPGASLVLTTNAILASQAILCPMQCADLSMHVFPLVENDVETLAQSRHTTIPIYILRTMLDTTAHGKQASAQIKAALADQVLETVIKRRTALRDAMSLNQSIFQYDPKSDVAAAYRQLAKEVMRHV
jgi:chromosome partitioning protein